MSMSRATKRRPARRPERGSDASRRVSRGIRTSSIRGSRRRCGATRRSAGRRTRRELRTFLPSSVLVTGFDIIFFWVARMIMTTVYFTGGEIPFRDGVHQRDRPRRGRAEDVEVEEGNVLDPLDLIDGDDARHADRRAHGQPHRSARQAESIAKRTQPASFRTGSRRSEPTRCGSRSRVSRRSGARSISISTRWRATAISATSCGTRRASS